MHFSIKKICIHSKLSTEHGGFIYVIRFVFFYIFIVQNTIIFLNFFANHCVSSFIYVLSHASAKDKRMMYIKAIDLFAIAIIILKVKQNNNKTFAIYDLHRQHSNNSKC